MSDDILSDHFGHEKHELKASIISVATQIFATHGYHNTSFQLIALSSLQEVAEILTYFDSKEALLLATLREGQRRVERWFLENRPIERTNKNHLHKFISALSEHCMTSMEGRLLAKVAGESSNADFGIVRAIETMAESWTESIYHIVSAFYDASESTRITFSFLSQLLGAYAMEGIYQNDEFILDACQALGNSLLDKAGEVN